MTCRHCRAEETLQQKVLTALQQEVPGQLSVDFTCGVMTRIETYAPRPLPIGHILTTAIARVLGTGLMALLAIAIKTHAVVMLQVLSDSLYWTTQQVTQGIATDSQNHTASLAMIVLVTVLAVLLGCSATAYHILRD